jgi:hypothetical protein
MAYSGCGRKGFCPTPKYDPGFCMEHLKKGMKIFIQFNRYLGQGIKTEYAEYEAESANEVTTNATQNCTQNVIGTQCSYRYK